MAEIDRLLTHLKDDGGSDLHLAAGLEPRIRKSGRLVPITGEPVLTDEMLRDLLEEIANEKQWDEYSGCGPSFFQICRKMSCYAERLALTGSEQ